MDYFIRLAAAMGMSLAELLADPEPAVRTAPSR
jgi:pyrroloquinoline quinone (PQQ) biosynthesis protein C